MKNLTRYLTVVFAVIPLSALLFHLFEMPAELSLSKENYRIVQDFCGGLSWLVIFEIAALILTVTLILVEKKKKRTYRNLLIALICFVLSVVLFFIFILPAYISTSGWSNFPPEWETLRSQWEYTNAIRAVISFTAFSFIVLALIKNRNYYRVYE